AVLLPRAALVAGEARECPDQLAQHRGLGEPWHTLGVHGHAHLLLARVERGIQGLDLGERAEGHGPDVDHSALRRSRPGLGCGWGGVPNQPAEGSPESLPPWASLIRVSACSV